MSDAPKETLEAAIASEEKLADRALAIREGESELTPELLDKLHPLLCEPIPSGFIKEVPKLEKGKPYASKGVRSVQVQIDRMNNVLGPRWWWFDEEHNDAGTVCKVTVYIGDQAEDVILVERSSRGGVDRGSSLGNVFKGSFTNAAKPAFARVGPGHEVYLGAADLDPDVNQEVAEETPEATAESTKANTVGPSIAKALIDRAWKVPAAEKQFQLAASHAADRDVGPCGTKGAATKAVAGMTFDQVQKLDRWVAKKEEGGDDE